MSTKFSLSTISSVIDNVNNVILNDYLYIICIYEIFLSDLRYVLVNLHKVFFFSG